MCIHYYHPKNFPLFLPLMIFIHPYIPLYGSTKKKSKKSAHWGCKRLATPDRFSTSRKSPAKNHQTKETYQNGLHVLWEVWIRVHHQRLCIFICKMPWLCPLGRPRASLSLLITLLLKRVLRRVRRLWYGQLWIRWLKLFRQCLTKHTDH